MSQGNSAIHVLRARREIPIEHSCDMLLPFTSDGTSLMSRLSSFCRAGTRCAFSSYRLPKLYNLCTRLQVRRKRAYVRARFVTFRDPCVTFLQNDRTYFDRARSASIKENQEFSSMKCCARLRGFRCARDWVLLHNRTARGGDDNMKIKGRDASYSWLTILILTERYFDVI